MIFLHGCSNMRYRNTMTEIEIITAKTSGAITISHGTPMPNKLPIAMIIVNQNPISINLDTSC